MRDFITLGSAPIDEDCVQVSSRVNYIPAMRAECRRYKEMLEYIYPKLPESCYFGVKNFEHDFGTYFEVVIYYDDEIEEAVDFANDLQDNQPEKWCNVPNVV